MQDNEVNSYSNNFLEKKAKEIKDKIRSLQFVDDCPSRKKLICEVDQKCGYSCQLHFLIVCFIQAYYQNRTIIFKDLYDKNNQGGNQENNRINRFGDSYLPFSNCNIIGNETVFSINIGIFFLNLKSHTGKSILYKKRKGYMFCCFLNP